MEGLGFYVVCQQQPMDEGEDKGYRVVQLTSS